MGIVIPGKIIFILKWGSESNIPFGIVLFHWWKNVPDHMIIELFQDHMITELWCIFICCFTFYCSTHIGRKGVFLFSFWCTFCLYKMYFLTKSVNLKIVLVSSPMNKNCLLTNHANWTNSVPQWLVLFKGGVCMCMYMSWNIWNCHDYAEIEHNFTINLRYCVRCRTLFHSLFAQH